jgi:hypothetical protein
MTTELWLLLAAVLLGFVQIVLQAQSMNMQHGYRWNAIPARFFPSDGRAADLTAR